MIKEIKICMGSACFARGNADNLRFIEDYIKENNLRKIQRYNLSGIAYGIVESSISTLIIIITIIKLSRL